MSSDHYRTMSDYAYAELRRRIVTGELVPGERIDQDAEANRIDVSRMPIREALRRLASESLIDIVPHRGAQVRPLSADDLEDLWSLRIPLESMASKLGTESLTTEDLDRMCDLIPEMEAIVERNDPDAWLVIDWSFHSLLYTATGRPRLVRYIQSLREEASRYRRIGLAMPDELQVSLDGHFQILEACEQRDGKEVERIIRGSLDHSRERLLEALSDDPALGGFTSNQKQEKSHEG